MGNLKTEVRELCQALREQGWVTEFVKNGHIKCTAPSGRSLQIASSPSDRRNIKNAITRLKRIGYVPAK